MIIHKRIVLDPEDIQKLEALWNSVSEAQNADDCELDGQSRPDGIGETRNIRRRYYRLLDKITGEPGVYGYHLSAMAISERFNVCYGNIGEVYLEHRVHGGFVKQDS
jgi:hypothetical protein